MWREKFTAIQCFPLCANALLMNGSLNGFLIFIPKREIRTTTRIGLHTGTTIHCGQLWTIAVKYFNHVFSHFSPPSKIKACTWPPWPPPFCPGPRPRAAAAAATTAAAAAAKGTRSSCCCCYWGGSSSSSTRPRWRVTAAAAATGLTSRERIHCLNGKTFFLNQRN